MPADRRDEPKVVLTEHLSDEAVQWLSEQVHLVRQGHEDAAALRQEIADARGLVVRTYTRVDDALLEAAPHLQVVARAGVGLDSIDLDACRRRKIQVVYTPEANTQAVVEYTLGLILDAIRPRRELADYVTPPTFHRLRREQVGGQLNERVLGILGMGRIGRRVAEVGRAVGMRVIYNDLLTRSDLALAEDDPSEFVDKAALWEQADVLSVHVDGRAENHHLLDGDVLGRLKASCLLINTARGFLIDADALAAWAGEVEASGGRAVLDVHDPEPPPDDYPLFGLPNVRLLPHLASRTDRALANMSWVVRDVVRVLNGEKAWWAAV